MKRKITLYTYLLAGAALLLAASCSREDTTEASLPAEETVPVALSVGIAEGQFQTGNGYEPMTRAEGEVLARIYNQYMYLIMKKIDGNWVVERLDYARIDASTSSFGSLDITSQLPDNTLRIDLTPGEYKMAVVLNYNSASTYTKKLNPATGKYDLDVFAPGTVVLAAGASESELPPLIGYRVLDSSYGMYDRSEEILYNEIFAGTTDFTVTKTEGLAASGSAIPVQVATTRKVGSFRIYIRETEANPDFDDELNTYVFYTMTANNAKGFPRGLNVWGKPYYSSTPLTKMDGAFYMTKAYIPTAQGNYKIPALNGTRWFGHYYFSDPDNAVPFTVSDITANEQQGGINWEFDYSIDRVLYHNQQDAFALTSTEGTTEIKVPNGEGGESTERYAKMALYPENVVDLFTPNYDWNTTVQ